MFYSRDILCVRGGQFAIIWAAANSFKKLTRREYLKVDVQKTCEDIIDYIMLRAEPRRGSNQRPRLSLYLSSQLMYGVIRVYTRQLDFLLTDISSLTSRFRLSFALADIDINMKVSGREKDTVTLSDPLVPANIDDPFYFEQFRLSLLDLEIPLHFDDPSILMWKSAPGSAVSGSPRSSQSDVLSTPKMKSLPQVEDIRSPHTVANELITLKELESPSLRPQMPPVQSGEEDFGVPPGQELDMLLQMEHIPDLQKDLTDLEKEQLVELQSDVPSTPTRKTTPPHEATPGGDVPTTAKRPRKSHVPSSPGVTPVQPQIPIVRPRSTRSKRKLPVLTMDLSPITPDQRPPAIRRHRRHLFADTQTQISRETMRMNMRTTEDILQPLKLMKFEPTLNDLFTKGARKGVNLRLLNRNMTRECEGLKLYDSDAGRPFWYAPGFTSTSESVSSDEPRFLPDDLSIIGDEVPAHVHLSQEPVAGQEQISLNIEEGQVSVEVNESAEMERQMMASLNLTGRSNQSQTPLHLSSQSIDRLISPSRYAQHYTIANDLQVILLNLTGRSNQSQTALHLSSQSVDRLRTSPRMSAVASDEDLTAKKDGETSQAEAKPAEKLTTLHEEMEPVAEKKLASPPPQEVVSPGLQDVLSPLLAAPHDVLSPLAAPQHDMTSPELASHILGSPPPAQYDATPPSPNTIAANLIEPSCNG